MKYCQGFKVIEQPASLRFPFQGLSEFTVALFVISNPLCCSLGSLLLLLLGKSHLRGKLHENMVMVMIVCSVLVLFLFAPSSIILVHLTLRLHFVAHYGGRGRWS